MAPDKTNLNPTRPMDPNITYYLLAILAFVVGIVVIKKVASCLIRSIAAIVVLAALAFLAWKFGLISL